MPEIPRPFKVSHVSLPRTKEVQDLGELKHEIYQALIYLGAYHPHLFVGSAYGRDAILVLKAAQSFLTESL